MPQQLVLLLIIFSTSLLFLAVSAQARSQEFDAGHALNKRFGRRFNLARTAPANSNTTTRSQRFLSQKKKKHHNLSREFLVAHNKVRRHFNEPRLKWDKKLARYASHWAALRAPDCMLMHSYGPYGENLFWGKYDHWTATEAVQSWVREYKSYDAHTNECAQGQMCGHYTQIVWRDTSRIGCARRKCHTGGVFIVCEYDPPGNYINENPFGLRPGAASAMP